jgi:hypothetical protein
VDLASVAAAAAVSGPCRHQWGHFSPDSLQAAPCVDRCLLSQLSSHLHSLALSLTSFYLFNISLLLSLPFSNYFRFCLQYPFLPSPNLFIYSLPKSSLARSLQRPPRVPPRRHRRGLPPSCPCATESILLVPHRHRWVHLPHHAPTHGLICFIDIGHAQPRRCRQGFKFECHFIEVLPSQLLYELHITNFMLKFVS